MRRYNMEIEKRIPKTGGCLSLYSGQDANKLLQNTNKNVCQPLILPTMPFGVGRILASCPKFSDKQPPIFGIPFLISIL